MVRVVIEEPYEGYLDVEEYGDLVASVARNVGRRFSGFASRDDFTQEAWLWLYSHPAKVEEYSLIGDVGRRKLSTSLYHACNAFGQKAKADHVGYKPDDLFYYSIDLLKKVLPVVFENGMDIMDEKYADFPDRSLWLDVIDAVSILPEHEYRLIHMVFSNDLGENRMDLEDEPGYEAVAKLLQIEIPAARGRITRILRKMQRHLGGENPMPRRKVKSNAASLAETRNVYDG